MATTAPDPGIDDHAFRRGYGTFEVAIDRIDDDAYTETIATAIDVGFRHLDTAQVYDTESLVGDAIRRSDVPRDELFVATKLSWENHAYDDAVTSAEASRERLGVDAIDLLYVHVPTDTYHPDETLPALDHLVEEGVGERVGVSNFTPELLREANDALDVPLFAHQVEMHPLLHQSELHELAMEHGHWLVAFSPYVKGMVREIVELRAVADRHDVTPFDVSLAWLLSKKHVAVLSHSRDPTHMRETVTGPRVTLEDSDFARIDAIDREFRAWDGRSDPWNQPEPDRFD